MNQILVCEEKHETRYIDATDVEKASAKIVQERLDDGYWYEGREAGIAEAAVEVGKAYGFLMGRQHYEYERVELKKIEPV